ncbi:MAG: hypothetical protein C0483_05330 [Pirellula sp.]|nr:hypothetical protein [Pirellula sp.]
MSTEHAMSDSLERSATSVVDAVPPSRPSSLDPELIPVLSSRWALTWKHLAATAMFGALFVFLNHIPLRGTDLWGHLEWGKRILAERSIPTEDPIQPLAVGMQVVDLSWLSQAIYAAVEQAGGPIALVGLFTLTVWLTYLLVARTCYLQTRSALLSTVVTMAALGIGWSRISTIRPENFALLLFAALLWLLVGRRVRRDESVLADDTRGDWRLWLGIPVIFALWANLHGSFFCGLALLGCYLVGRVCEVLWNERSVRAVLLDREVRRLLYWCELAAAAVLVNPYTMDAYVEAIRFSQNLNLRDVLEWAPLSLRLPAGWEFAASVVALGLLLRLSKRPFAAADVAALLLFGLAATLQLRMIGWFAMVWAVAAAPHVADLVTRWLADRAARRKHVAETNVDVDDEAPSLPVGHSFRYTLGCLGVLWIAFAFSSLSRPLLGGAPRTPEALFGEQSPQQLVAWLQKNPPTGQVLNPQYWGDWLAWAGPKPMQLFATTNIHLTPRSVWQDYGRMVSTQPGWDTTLDRYRVQTVIVDRALQAQLARSLRTEPNWMLVYEDPQAQVFRRKPKAESSTKAAEPKPTACH